MSHIRPLMGLVFVTAVALAAFGDPARAQGAKKKEPQGVSNLQLHEVHHLLQSIKITLEKADHDYGGHRGAAIKSIGEAEHQIRLALEHVKGKVGKGGGKAFKSSNEPQALSDAQLAESIKPLRASIVMLEKADNDYGGHKERAIKDIHAAIVDLEKAIAFIKSKGK